MKQATLSIIIPAYNVEHYLDRCVMSLLSRNTSIEIIIVNDGSTDSTLKIANKYKKQSPDTVTVINQKNGGHGAAINAGLKVALGKYVRILDSDDWLNQDSLGQYIDYLNKHDADIILTEFSFNDFNQQKNTHFRFENLPLNKKMAISYMNNLPDNSDKINIFSLHTITIKTNLLKKVWEDGLLEKTFYEDQEYVTKCILASNKFIATPIDVYQYFIGRDEQSMNANKMFKNRRQHEKVILKILDLIEKCPDKEKKEFLEYRLSKIIRTHYWIYFYNTQLTREERCEYKKIKKIILKSNPALLNKIDIKYKIRLFIGRNKKKIMRKK